MLPNEPDQTPPSIRRLIPQVKMPPLAVLRQFPAGHVGVVERRLSEPAECVYDPCFERPDAERLMTGPLHQVLRGAERRSLPANDDSGVDLLAYNPIQELRADTERYLFLRLNYSRHRVMQLLERYDRKRLSEEGIRDLVQWETAAAEVRGEIVRLNMPLVLAMAKRTRITAVDLADLISEGNLALLRSVDKFDPNRGFKFSTYACRAILKSFSRVATRSSRYRGHFPTEFDPVLEKSTHLSNRRETVEHECVDELKSILGRNLANLSEVERQVIAARFALDRAASPMADERGKTLEQVGEMIGVTKERVRQIQNKALRKLRAVLEDQVLAGH